MILKIFTGIALLLQFIASYVFRPKQTKTDKGKTLITPPGSTFGLCWSLIYLLSIAQLIYICIVWDDNSQMAIFITQIVMAVLNSLWLIFFERFENQVWQLIDMILLYGVLIYHLTFTRTITKLGDILIKIFSSVYTGWITQALMLSIVIVSKQYNLMNELYLCRTLLLISVAFDIIITFTLYSGYVCFSQLITLITTFPSLSDQFLRISAVMGMVIDIAIIILQIVYEVITWQKQN
ncbi:TspO/MBR-related_protein [Hexamita inflata]|uniref:TspO/MBR-related protein n=1 Tax=Hexamita inflata TaxID=28002 RepID=A0AA86P5F2_9EUKA|nr:TspO/MBR-related protein [Hexamita inflata]